MLVVVTRVLIGYEVVVVTVVVVVMPELTVAVRVVTGMLLMVVVVKRVEVDVDGLTVVVHWAQKPY